MPQGVLDFLVYLAPSLLVFGTAWFLIRQFLARENRLKLIETRMAVQRDTLPLRLQAYERLTLFLERISPNVMLINQYDPDLNVRRFHQKLLEQIRNEFEHNLTQQIYVSGAVWAITRNAKEEVVRIINNSASSLEQDAPAFQLSKKIFDSMLENEDFPTQRALNVIRTEVAQIYS